MAGKMELKPKLTSAAGIAVGDNQNRSPPARGAQAAEFPAPIHHADHEVEPYTRV